MRATLGTLLVMSSLILPTTAVTAAPSATASARSSYDCPPSARALGFSDSLDKLSRHGVTLGGLSNLAWDRHTRSWASTVDNHDTDPARVWFFRDLAHPTVTRDPLVLRRPDGTAYTGLDADDEGLAVLPGGRFVVSSETEPVIREFSRRGRQLSVTRVPHRFRVSPAGQATDNATLEGLTLTRNGWLVASMEGTLNGDVSPGGDDTYRRMLVYARAGDGFSLRRQIGYRVESGNRIAEVQAYGRDSLLVLEAAYDPETGNTVELYAVPHTGHARDVSRVANLSAAPKRDVLRKRLVADVTACPSLGAPSRQPQTNPLLDNYEGMAVRTGRHHHARVTLISDDNFNPDQITRVLRLAARLPGRAR